MAHYYEYYDSVSDYNSDAVTPLLDEEKKISKKIVSEHDNRDADKCPLCNSIQISIYFKKWGIDYYRCTNCKSIFANVSEDVLKKYRNNPGLIAYRKSEDYQRAISDNRQISWSEYSDWIYLRSFRYLNTKKFKILDVGNRYYSLQKILSNANYCDEYTNVNSIISEKKLSDVPDDHYDLILCNDYIQQFKNIEKEISKIVPKLHLGGLLIMGVKLGTGFDILTLRGKSRIYPYENITLPSQNALNNVLKKVGMKVLDNTTPGQMDVSYVLEKKDRISPQDSFISYLLETGDKRVLADFQYFLQKNCLSSYSRIVARRVQ